MVSQRQSVPQWLICRKAMARSKLSTIGGGSRKRASFLSEKKEPAITAKTFSRYGGPRPTEVSGKPGKSGECWRAPT